MAATDLPKWWNISDLHRRDNSLATRWGNFLVPACNIYGSTVFSRLVYLVCCAILVCCAWCCSAMFFRVFGKCNDIAFHKAVGWYQCLASSLWQLSQTAWNLPCAVCWQGSIANSWKLVLVDSFNPHESFCCYGELSSLHSCFWLHKNENFGAAFSVMFDFSALFSNVTCVTWLYHVFLCSLVEYQRYPQDSQRVQIRAESYGLVRTLTLLCFTQHASGFRFTFACVLSFPVHGAFINASTYTRLLHFFQEWLLDWC